ncbi:hypothetical protein ACV229_25550 [Burkholderia sp. MR1-5-21]
MLTYHREQQRHDVVAARVLQQMVPQILKRLRHRRERCAGRGLCISRMRSLAKHL